MSRKRRNNQPAYVIEHPPELRGDRRTAKLLLLLDSIKPAAGNPHKEPRPR